MRLPSVKTLADRLDLDPETAIMVRRVLECPTRSAVCAISAAAENMRRQCYHEPALQDLKLRAVDVLIDGCGVAYIPAGNNKNSPAITYINMGDTYIDTLMWIDGHYRVACWGDIVERGNYD